MAFFKKSKEVADTSAVQGVQARSIAQQLAPLAEASKFAIKEKQKLQSEEAVTIEGIETIEDSFDLVQQKYGNIIVRIAVIIALFFLIMVVAIKVKAMDKIKLLIQKGK